MDVQPTEQDKGLAMTIHVTAYDNGMLHVNGRPVNSTNDDHVLSWMQANEVIGIKLTEFYRQFAKREKLAA